MEIPEGFIKEVINGLEPMSGKVVFRVTGSWANKGRVGRIDDVVIARDAVEAIKIAWEPEDDRDLRTINAEWLCPIESIKQAGKNSDLDEESTCKESI